jgi:hypothetical protein
MNERILKLKNQAAEYANEVFEYHGKDYREIVMEKFAELIVAECQERVEHYIRDCGEINSLPDTVILKHFGG